MKILTVSDLIKVIVDQYESFHYTLDVIPFTNVSVDIKHINDKSSYIGRGYAQLQYTNIIKFNVLDFNITLNIHSIQPIGNEIKKFVNRIGTMIKIFYKNISRKTIIINMFNYNAPRFIPEQYETSPSEFESVSNNDIFNCTNGYYQQRKNDINIVITRENTNSGLLIHELCHMCKLDFGGYGMFEQWNQDKQRYGIKTDSEFTEGINNAISSIIHSIFTALERTGDFKKEFIRVFYSEYQYAKDMVGNLLHYFKCNTIGDLKEKGYNQNSMVFEYIVLRYIYLKNLHKLLHFAYEEDDNVDGYYDLFIECLKNEEGRQFKFNKRMIIDTPDVNKRLTRMEYYLFK